MKLTAVATALFFVGARAISNYQLVSNYTAPTFFDNFEFFTKPDPTAGSVEYVDMNTANTTGLAGFASSDQFSNSVYLGVDSSSKAVDARKSTRISSIDTFNSSTLLISDIRHHPSGCALWPAYWLVGPTWPHGGEIDILEQINLANTTKYALHTYDDLTMYNLSDPKVANSTGMATEGTFSNLECASSGNSNVGCVVEGLKGSFGPGFNDNGGAVMALEYVSRAIRIWQFHRNEVPGDILSGAPVPDSWRTPDAHFMSSNGTSLDAYFYNLTMVFNTDICGQWPEQVWSTSECAGLATTCAEYAKSDPDAAFKNAYWLIDSIQVYKPGNGTSDNSTVIPATPAVNTTVVPSYRRRARRSPQPSSGLQLCDASDTECI